MTDNRGRPHVIEYVTVDTSRTSEYIVELLGNLLYKVDKSIFDLNFSLLFSKLQYEYHILAAHHATHFRICTVHTVYICEAT